jgi:hypothetical protein
VLQPKSNNNSVTSVFSSTSGNKKQSSQKPAPLSQTPSATNGKDSKLSLRQKQFPSGQSLDSVRQIHPLIEGIYKPKDQAYCLSIGSMLNHPYLNPSSGVLPCTFVFFLP